jgi:penicillin-binding protein 1A
MINKIIKSLLLIGLLVAALLTGMFLYAYNVVDSDVKKVINYAPNISTEILDRNGKRIAYIFKKRHRLYATYNEIPVYVIEGLIAMEDTKFFEHNGINPDAILRAIIKDIKAGHFVEGGSTITQQLIKNIMFSNKKKLSRKIKEVILAIKLEKKLSKEEILERYLNEIPYGNNYLGIKTAAEGYFRKSLSELTLKESAMLVGLPNAPSYYNPLRHYDRINKRANLILQRLKNLGWITQSEFENAKKERPKVYKTSLTQNIAPYVVDEVVRRLKGRFKDLKTGGYKIYTTIDLHKLNIAKKAVEYGFVNVVNLVGDDINKTDINGALVAVENNTGDILAMVGGVDYKKSPFNRATMTKRQPGSAFKPFVYQRALDLGYNPATLLPDLARSFKYKKNGKEMIWTPRNYERNFKGFITLREALVESRNLATVNMVYDIGIDKIITRLKMLDVQNIPRNLSIALGNLALSPMKMAQIYTVFSNGGHMIEPRLVSKMVSKYGSIIYETRPKEIADFTKPEQAYLMTSILQDVIKRGTGKNAQVEGLELAGKTGTTNNYIDAWFCGYSPTITTIVWYGRDKYKTLGKNMTGGRAAAPVFSYFYYEMLQDNPNMPRKFKKPKGVYSGYINGKLELYTKISPLPNKANKVAQKPKKEQNSSIKDSNVVELYDDEKDNTINNNQPNNQHSNSEDVEVLF